MFPAKWWRLGSAAMLAAATLVGASASPAAGAPTTSVLTTLSTFSPDVPQGGNGAFIAGFTVTALDPADGPITVELTQDDAGDLLEMTEFSANLTDCTATPTLLQCTWTPTAVGEVATLGAMVSDFTLDAPGTVVTVTAGARIGATDLGHQTAAFTVTDVTAIVITPAVTATPGVITPPEESDVTATFTVDRLDANWGTIRIVISSIAFPSAVEESPDLSCTDLPVHSGLFWSRNCTWSPPSLGDRATIRLSIGDHTNPAFPPADAIDVGVSVQAGSGPESTAGTTITVDRRAAPVPSPVALLPAFTG